MPHIPSPPVESRKRKRDSEIGAPRIKYHVEQLGRSFERILKEDSREELRNVVRKKLSLDNKTSLELVQLRDGKLYDLEDDDDFEAFKAAAVEYSSLDVRVSFSPQVSTSGDIVAPSAAGASTSPEASASVDKDVNKRKQIAPTPSVGSAEDALRAVTPPGDKDDMSAPPHKKRRKGDVGVAMEKSGAGSESKGNVSKSKELEDMSAANQDDKPKKRRKISGKVVAGIDSQGSPMSLPVETASASKKLSTKLPQGAEKLIGQKQKVIHSSAPEAGTFNASTSARSEHSPHTSPSAQSTGLRSSASKFQKGRTLEEILASIDKGLASARSTKDGEVKKAQTKAPVGKNPLSGERASVPATPHVEAPSTSKARSSDLPFAKEAVTPPNATPVVSTDPKYPLPLAKPRKTPKSAKASSLPCPVCLQPFHLRYLCPVTRGGGAALQERIAELEAEGGREDLVKELREWLAKERKGRSLAHKGPAIEDADHGPTVTHSSAKADGRRRDSPMSPPGWTVMKPRDERLSEVTVESRGEGSEGEESSTSDSDSNAPDEQKNEKGTSQSGAKSKSASESESESKSDQSSGTAPGSEPATGLTKKSPSVDLEHVDLEALVRGPPVKIQLSKLMEEEDESDRTEEDADLLQEEEEEEERRSRRTKGRKEEASSSPEGTSDTDEGSEAQLETKSDAEKSIVIDARPSTGDDGGGVADNAIGVEAVAVDKSELYDISGSDSSAVSQGIQETSTGEDAATSERPKTPRADEHPALPSSTPTRPPTSRVTAIFRSPLVQGMKDRSGNLPLNPPDDETRPGPSILPPDDDASMPPPEEKAEKPKRGRPRTSAKPASSRSRVAGQTATSTAAVTEVLSDGSTKRKDRMGQPLKPRDEETRSGASILPTDDDASMPPPEENAEQPKRGRPRATSQPKPAARSARSRSRTGRETSTSPAESVSDAPPKRRGRPPLSEAVKAQRKAIKDAEKAARAAEKRAKAEKKKAGKKEPVPPKSREQTKKLEAAHSASEADLAQASTPVPQWEILVPQTASSTLSQSLPAIDQLVSSSPSTQLDKGDTNPKEAAISGRADDNKASRATSAVIPSRGSGSSRRDEDDVENIIGSTKQKTTPSVRQPLFLPGASQMTQTRFLNHEVDETRTTHEEQSDSASSGESEREGGQTGTALRKTMESPSSHPSKAMFPSLSQLSFDKFRPSFLLPGRSSPKNNEKPHHTQHPDEESESDEEESSEEEKKTHVPKGRLAGTGVIGRRKSRGLLQA